MPNKSTFQHYNLNSQNRNSLTIDEFLGVDYTEAQLQVANNHAVDIKNFIYKDKVNQKRNGWEQLTQVKEQEYYDKNLALKYNTKNINGVYTFQADDKNIYTIAHIGHLLAVVSGIGKGKSFLNIKLQYILKDGVVFGVPRNNCVDIELQDNKSFGFVKEHKLFLLDGKNFLVISLIDGEFIIEKVQDSKYCYIPHTTVGITAKNSLVSSATPLDDLNIMTKWKKNKLISGMPIDENAESQNIFDYELDSDIVAETDADLNDITLTINTLKDNQEEGV